MTQHFLPTMEPDWPLVGDRVVLRCGTEAEISSGELMDPLWSDKLRRLCAMWPVRGPDKWSKWKFIGHSEALEREGDHWRER